MANLLQYNNKSTIIDRLVLQLFETVYADYEAGTIQTETELYYRLKEAVQTLCATLYKPNFNYRPAGLTPASAEYNQMMEEVLLDLNYLITDCQSLNTSLTKSFTEQEQRRTAYSAEIRYISQKISKLKEKMSPTLMNEFIIETNSFTSSGNSTTEQDKAYVNQSDGVLMLPYSQNLSYNSQLTVSILDGSTGIPGNTHVADQLSGQLYFDGESNLHLDLTEIIDGNEDTWFEYEIFKVSDSVYQACHGYGFNYEEGFSWITDDNGLTLKLQLTLKVPQYCNWLSVNPYVADQKGIKASYLTRCYVSDGASQIQDLTTVHLLDETVVLTFKPQLVSTLTLVFDQQHYYQVQVGHQAYFKLNAMNFNVLNSLDTENSRRHNGPLPSIQYLGLTYNPKTKTYVQPSHAYGEAGLKGEELIKKNLFQAQPDEAQAKSKLELIPAFRYSIGIKQLRLAYYEFNERGEYISDAFTTRAPITRIALETHDFVPDTKETKLIQYFINLNEGETWYPIVPISRSYEGICQYEINNSNLDRYLRPNRKSQSQGFVTSFEEIKTVRLKIILTRSSSEEQPTPMVYDYRLKLTTDGDDFDY